MNPKFQLIILFLLFLLVALPVGINSAILDENNTTQTNTTILNVPDVRQPTNSSSGPTSLQAVLVYYGTDTSISTLINITNTTENGTTPDNIAQAARSFGLSADVKENLTLQDLQNNLNQGRPVIIACQAGGGNNTNWTNVTNQGLYMVVIGMDEDNIYFEDPAILGSRGYMPKQEFLERWHYVFNQNATNQTVNNQTDNNQTGNNQTDNNQTRNLSMFTHLGIIISGGIPANLPPFIKIN